MVLLMAFSSAIGRRTRLTPYTVHSDSSTCGTSIPCQSNTPTMRFLKPVLQAVGILQFWSENLRRAGEKQPYSALHI